MIESSSTGEPRITAVTDQEPLPDFAERRNMNITDEIERLEKEKAKLANELSSYTDKDVRSKGLRKLILFILAHTYAR